MSKLSTVCCAVVWWWLKCSLLSSCRPTCSPTWTTLPSLATSHVPWSQCSVRLSVRRWSNRIERSGSAQLPSAQTVRSLMPQPVQLRSGASPRGHGASAQSTVHRAACRLCAWPLCRVFNAWGNVGAGASAGWVLGHRHWGSG